MSPVSSLTIGSSSPAAICGCALKRLLDHRRAGAGKADDEDRLRDVGADAGARQDLRAAARRRSSSVAGPAPRLRRPDRLGRSARAACACASLKAAKASAWRPIRSSSRPFSLHSIGPRPPPLAPSFDVVERGERLVVVLDAAMQDRALQQDARVSGRQAFRPRRAVRRRGRNCGRSPPSAPSRKGSGRSSGSSRTDCFVEFARLRHPALVLEVPGEIGDEDRARRAQQFMRAAVMVLADLGPLRLGHDHAHQIVRLRSSRGDAHGVARVKLGLGERALVEEQRARAPGSPADCWDRAARSA